MTATSTTGVGQGSADRYRESTQILKILQNNEISVAFKISENRVIANENPQFGISTTSIYRTSFTNSSLTGDILRVNHSLANKYTTVVVYDNTDTAIIPKDVILVDSNHLNVDLTGFTPITGTWNVCVVG